MTAKDTVRAAREMLEKVTPLKGDCGRVCGAACCRPDETGRGGMLLFPGEEALYAPWPDWARLEEAGGHVKLAILMEKRGLGRAEAQAQVQDEEIIDL